jgi:hypothetical protein
VVLDYQSDPANLACSLPVRDSTFSVACVFDLVIVRSARLCSANLNPDRNFSIPHENLASKGTGHRHRIATNALRLTAESRA